MADLFGADTLKEIQKIHQISKTSDTPLKIGFTCSAYDLLHSGHVLSLQDARDQCDFLVIALQTDPTLDRKSKNKPVQTWEERYIMVSGIKYIDYILKYSTESDLLKILNALNPDVRILGSDWRGKNYTGHELPIPIYWHERTHSYSTTRLRGRIFDAEVQRYLNSRENSESQRAHMKKEKGGLARFLERWAETKMRFQSVSGLMKSYLQGK